MALPASGDISLLDIKGEHGGPSTPSLTDYYNGGTYVLAIPINSPIPVFGNIAITDFYGTESLTIQQGVLGANNTTAPTREGFANNFFLGTFGTYSPTPTTIKGDTVLNVVTAVNLTPRHFLEIYIDNFSALQAHFTTVSIEGTFAGGSNPRIITWATASATNFGSDAAGTYWDWDLAGGASDHMVTGNNYDITFQWS